MTVWTSTETPPPAVQHTPPPANTPSANAPSILIVDDSRVCRLVLGRMLEKQGGWRLSFAADGVEAMEAIAASPPHVVITDIQMPRMNGLELVQRVRERYGHIPVILMTAEGSEDVAMAALRAGAASYVPKRVLEADLTEVLGQVLAASRQNSDRARAMAGMVARTSHYVLENDPTLVLPLIGLLRDDLLAVGLCDATGATRVGIALEEALLNAVYHGNLGISSELKQIGDGSAFHRLAAERRTQSPYRDRRVRVTARVTAEQALFVIADQGPGFDVASLPDPTDPANLERPSGRGLLLMRTFMDEVDYNRTGNRVALLKRRDLRTGQ